MKRFVFNQLMWSSSSASCCSYFIFGVEFTSCSAATASPNAQLKNVEQIAAQRLLLIDWILTVTTMNLQDSNRRTTNVV